MSNVIKSFAVVDNRSGDRLGEHAQEADFGMPVIKRGIVNKNSVFLPRAMPPKDQYLEELNRIRVEIEEAKRELSTVRRQERESREAVEALKQQRKELEKFEGLNIEAEVVRILQEAEENASKILERARQETRGMADDMKAKGYLEGLEQGANEARQQVREENRPGVEKAARLIEELSSIREELLRQNEKEITDLTVAIAEKIIGREIKEDPKTVVDMLREVMEQNRREEYIKIIVSADLMPIEAKVSEQVKQIIETLGQQVDIFVDPDGNPGGLVVETSGGYTDLGVDTQLNNIADTLRDAQMSQEL